jgi:hypothetical protein
MATFHPYFSEAFFPLAAAIYRELVKMAEQIGTDKTDESLVLPAPCAPLSTKSLVRNRPTVFYFDVQILYRI